MPELDVRAATKPFLMDVAGRIDAGHTDEHIIDVSFTVTKDYADFVKRNEKDVQVMQPDGMKAFSSSGTGKRAVETLLMTSLGIVQNLIEAGVPQDVALRLLPHELYEKLAAAKSAA